MAPVGAAFSQPSSIGTFLLSLCICLEMRKDKENEWIYSREQIVYLEKDRVDRTHLYRQQKGCVQSG